MRQDWLDILNQVKTGELSLEEASQKLEALGLGETHASQPPRLLGSPYESASSESWQPMVGEAAASAEADAPPVVEDSQPDLGWWKEAWLIPFWAGIGILVLSAILMGWAYSNSQFFWFYCAWLPLMFGVLALFLGWWSRQARWLHVRVQDADGSRVSISLPLPLRFAGWALRIFGRFIPQLQDKDLSDMPMIFSSLAEAEGPLTVEVDDGGDRVRVYIL